MEANNYRNGEMASHARMLRFNLKCLKELSRYVDALDAREAARDLRPVLLDFEELVRGLEERRVEKLVLGDLRGVPRNPLGGSGQKQRKASWDIAPGSVPPTSARVGRAASAFSG